MKQRRSSRAFTLVELMIVVAVVGVLASLAIYGVRRNLLHAKTAEAKSIVGSIGRAAVSAYEYETTSIEVVKAGALSTQAGHRLCETSVSVPATDVSIAGKKYQSSGAKGQDYQAGDKNTGWMCLKFTLSEPQYYRYQYSKGAKNLTAITSPAVPTTGFAAEARGNLNADTVFSGFLLVGDIVADHPRIATTIAEDYPDE